MATKLSAVLLSVLPGVSAGEQFVAVTVEFLPAMVTAFSVYGEGNAEEHSVFPLHVQQQESRIELIH